MIRTLGFVFMLTVFVLSGTGMVSLVTAAVTNGHEATERPGTVVHRVQAAIWPVGKPDAKELYTYKHANFTGLAECEEGKNSPEIAMSLLNLLMSLQMQRQEPLEFEIKCVPIGKDD